MIKYDGIKTRVSFLIFLAIIVRSAEMLNQYDDGAAADEAAEALSKLETK